MECFGIKLWLEKAIEALVVVGVVQAIFLQEQEDSSQAQRLDLKVRLQVQALGQEIGEEERSWQIRYHMRWYYLQELLQNICILCHIVSML